MFKLLTLGNPKTLKGEKRGYITFILHLAPAEVSGYQMCPKSSPGCRAACLNTAGRGGMFRAGTNTNVIQEARKRKTRYFHENRGAFMTDLWVDIRKAIAYAKKRNLIPVFRLNGTSDIAWEKIRPGHGSDARNIMELFPEVKFYDYTKIPNRKNLPANYSLTFSRSENNEKYIPMAMENGMNVAVVFRAVPTTWRNIPVIDGDESDLRFTDPTGVIVGLKAKGRAKKDTTGFVI